MSEFCRIQQELYRTYRERRGKCLKAHEEAKRYLPGGDTRTATFFKPFPHFIEYGEGCYVWDLDGNRLIDFVNNYTSLIHGHGHSGIAKAVSDQMKRGTAFSAPIEAQTKLAKLICDRVKSVELLRFANSGTEATMHAVRGARAYTGRTRILKIEGGYHGSSDIFEASVDPDLLQAGPLDRPRPVPDSKGVPSSSLEQVIVAPFNQIEATKRIIEEHHAEIAAFIIEPVLGSAGMIEPQGDYLWFVREITKHYGIVLIFDEVVTFRLALGGAQQHYGVEPDMTTFGKIIGGGLPIGAFGGKSEIMKMYDPQSKTMYHSGTFNGNAVSMVAGIAALEGYGYKEIEHINNLGERFRRGCRKVFAEAGLNIQINGVGSLSNIIFSNREITEYRGVACSHEEFNVLLNLSLINRGVFNAPRGMFCISTPMTDADIDFAVGAVKESLLEILPAIKEKAPELCK